MVILGAPFCIVQELADKPVGDGKCLLFVPPVWVMRIYCLSHVSGVAVLRCMCWGHGD